MKKIIVTITILGLIPILAAAQISVGNNHPELKWRVRQTEHFQIIFHQGIESLAEAAAGIAEEIYEPITTDLGAKPAHKTTIILSDYDDNSNGMATPLGHYIFIWTQPFKKHTTGRMRWLRRVIAHEFAHEATFWALRNFIGTPWELLGLGFMPMWFIEGVAQYEAERWDDHREMLLRVANSDCRLLSAAKLDGFIGADQIDARLVYEQGHSLVRFITAKYGPDKIAEIIRKHRRFPISFNWSLKRAIGVSEKTLYRQWYSEISPQLRDDFNSKERITEIGNRFPSDLQGNYGLRWSPDGKMAAIVGMESFEEQVTRLYLCDSRGINLKEIAGPIVGSYFSWSPDSRRLVYSKARKGKHGSRVNDLFILDSETGDEQCITYSLRATDPAWSPDGKEIVFCVHQGAMSNLALYNVRTGSIKPLTEFSEWTEVFSPAWNSDNSRLVFSMIDSAGKRDIALIKRDGSGFRKLTDDFTDDRTPCWSPDGKLLAFISYRENKPDLFVINSDGSNITRLTDVAGGLFNPAWSPDGKSICVVGFESRHRIDLFSIPISQRPPQESDSTAAPVDHTQWRNALPPHPVPEQLSRYSIPDKSPFSKPLIKPYHSLLQVRSQLTFPNIGIDDGGLQFGIFNLLADPLNKHSLTWSVTQGRRTHFFFDYANYQFLPNLYVFASQYSYDRGNFLSQELWEKVLSISGQLTLPVNFGRSLLANHNISLKCSFQNIKNLDPTKFIEFPESSRPFEGWLNSVGLGYYYSNARPSIYYNIHPNDGFVAGISLAQSSKLLKSDLDFTQIIAILSSRHRLFKNHRLALRLGGFIHNGTQRVQSRYALGGSMVRGLAASIEGDRMLYCNFEYRFRIFKDFGLKFWILYLEGIYGALFTDAGYVWGTYLARIHNTNRFIWLKHDFAEREFVSTGGAELRCRFYLAGKYSFVCRSGVAWRPDRPGEKAHAYFLIGPVF